MSLYSNEMVPLQIDRAMGPRRYRSDVFAKAGQATPLGSGASAAATAGG